MNSLRRCLTVLDGQIPDRVPVIPQDAHVAAQLAGLNHLEYARNPEKRAAAVMAQRERFGYDGMIIGGDTVCLAESVGVKAVYSEAHSPRWDGACLKDPYSIHICGFCDPILDDWMTAEAPIWEIDHKTTFEKARRVTEGKTTIIGNLDTSTVMVSGTPDDVKREAKRTIDACRPECGLILSSGCLLAGDTPVENMQALADAAREFGRYDD